jgi:hypothetical protein
MILIEDLTYGGRALKAGEAFDTTSDTDAQILRAVGKARDADESEASEASEEEIVGSPKRYNRRDLRARK